MHPDGLPTPRRYWAVATVALVIGMAVMEGVITVIALPTLSRELGATPAASVWVVNAYQLAIIVSVLPLASLGEIVGYRRVYQAGLAVFTVGSLACALADSLPMLVAARTLQGLGAAGIMSVNSAVIRFTYPAHLLGRGIGFNAFIVAVAAAIAPTVAAGILSVASWPWLFAFNVPIGMAALVIGHLALPRTALNSRRFDVPAALLNALTFGGLVVGVGALSEGQPLAPSIAALAVGVAAGVALAIRSRSQAEPLAPVDLLRIKVFALSMATSSASFAAQSFAFVALPFVLEYAMGRSVTQTGLLMTPWSIGVAFSAPIAGRLSDRYPGAVLTSIGLGLMAAGLTALALLGVDARDLAIVGPMVACGVGFGMFQAPNNRTLVTTAPPHRAGSAAGLLATARLVGQTVGATSAVLMFRLSGGSPQPRVLLVAAGFSLIAAAVSWSKREKGRAGA